MNTITTPNFSGKITKVIAEIQVQTCIDEVEAEIIKELLQDALNEHAAALNEYYDEEHYIAVSRAQHRAYDEGHSDGYYDGYDDGYDDGRSAV